MSKRWYHMLPKGENCPGHDARYTSVYCAGMTVTLPKGDPPKPTIRLMKLAKRGQKHGR